jgi:O-phospho-L-seryl-tRNASec:L-selenocysteinyl-tRNA synthase
MKPVTMFGSMLFKRGVSGTRVVARGMRQSVAGHSFEGYGAHFDEYPCDYLTFAAALGTTSSDVDEFVRRMKLALRDFQK